MYSYTQAVFPRDAAMVICGEENIFEIRLQKL